MLASVIDQRLLVVSELLHGITATERLDHRCHRRRCCLNALVCSLTLSLTRGCVDTRTRCRDRSTTTSHSPHPLPPLFFLACFVRACVKGNLLPFPFISLLRAHSFILRFILYFSLLAQSGAGRLSFCCQA